MIDHAVQQRRHANNTVYFFIKYIILYTLIVQLLICLSFSVYSLKTNTN